MSTLQAAINPILRPTPINFSTVYASVKDKSLSVCSWPVQDTIKPPPGNYAALVSVDNFVFYNTLFNITRLNNTLKIISVWADANNVIQPVDTITVTVPEGQYDNDSLLAYLGQDGICNRQSGGFYYGLGVNGDTDYPPFLLNEFQPTRVHFQPPTAGGSGGVLGKWSTSGTPSSHQYIGFYLVHDDDTKALLNDMGLLDNSNDSSSPNNLIPIPGTSYSGLGATVRHTNTDESYFYYGDSSSPTLVNNVQQFLSILVSILNLSGPNALAISCEQLSAYSMMKNSYANFKSSGTLAIVPIVGSFGTKNVYQPTSPLFIYAPGLSINRFDFQIRNAITGALVNFNNAHWILTLRIEYVELAGPSQTANLIGYGTVARPLVRSQVTHPNIDDHHSIDKKRKLVGMDGGGIYHGN